MRPATFAKKEEEESGNEKETAHASNDATYDRAGIWSKTSIGRPYEKGKRYDALVPPPDFELAAEVTVPATEFVVTTDPSALVVVTTLRGMISPLRCRTLHVTHT